jgi:hypothetical protein
MCFRRAHGGSAGVYSVAASAGLGNKIIRWLDREVNFAGSCCVEVLTLEDDRKLGCPYGSLGLS